MKPHYPEARFVDATTVELRSPFNRDLVDQIKFQFPADCRSWDPVDRVWTIWGPSHQWARSAVDLFLTYFPHTRVIEPVHAETGTDHSRDDRDPDFAALHLLPTAPRPLVRAARNVLALEYHPDRGGSHEQMVAVNLAYECLEQRGCA